MISLHTGTYPGTRVGFVELFREDTGFQIARGATIEEALEVLSFQVSKREGRLRSQVRQLERQVDSLRQEVTRLKEAS